MRPRLEILYKVKHLAPPPLPPRAQLAVMIFWTVALVGAIALMILTR